VRITIKRLYYRWRAAFCKGVAAASHSFLRHAQVDGGEKRPRD